MLYIVQTLIGPTDFKQLLTTIRKDDALVLMDDGVYLQAKLDKSHHPIYVMQSHRHMRGLAAMQGTIELDMTGLVILTTQHTNSASW